MRALRATSESRRQSPRHPDSLRPEVGMEEVAMAATEEVIATEEMDLELPDEIGTGEPPQGARTQLRSIKAMLPPQGTGLTRAGVGLLDMVAIRVMETARA